MDISYLSIIPHLIYSFKSEHELVKSIEEISENFTTKREHISQYLNDPRLVSAYTAFYLITNFPKLSEILKWLPPKWVCDLKDCDFIDLGAGPGTFSLAWKALGGRGNFYQIEKSHLMMEQGKRLWNSFSHGELFQAESWAFSTGKKKFLFFGHSANEMEEEQVLKYIKQIEPEHILFIEPGTKDFFSKMLKIRSFLINENYNVLYPCPNSKLCPMINTSDWCHQYIYIKHDDQTERISQKAKKDRKLLPLIVHAYSKINVGVNPSERVVRVFPQTKFSHEWDVCHLNNLEHYQMMKRDLSKEDSKSIAAILAGDSVETELVKWVNKTKRVRLIKNKY